MSASPAPDDGVQAENRTGEWEQRQRDEYFEQLGVPAEVGARELAAVPQAEEDRRGREEDDEWDDQADRIGSAATERPQRQACEAGQSGGQEQQPVFHHRINPCPEQASAREQTDQ